MARESEAVRKAREFREQLIRQEDAALREMSRQWVRMENKLTDQYRLLVQDILDRQARGETVPRQMVYNMQRYQQMMAEIAKELPEYDAQAVRIITHYQRESYTLGLDAAEAVIMDTRPISPMWNRVGKDAAQITAGFAGNGAPLGQLLQRDYGDLGVKITDALVEGVALGKGAFATAKDMRDAMGMEYNRSVRIARTEINRAYRIANADQYKKSGVVTKVLRLCAKQANTCLACLMMDGDEVPGGVLDDHPNGRCATIAVTVGGIYPQWEHGDVWFEQQDEKIQRAIMGPGRYELWKEYDVDPHQMVRMKPNDVWGGSPTVISERELRERYNLTGGNRMLFSGQQTSLGSANDGRPKNEPEFLKKFAYEGTPEFGDQVYKYVNPGYKTGEMVYKENCQRCVIADEMQWRGYDVVAQAVNKNDPVDSRVDTCFEVNAKEYKNDPFGFKLFESKSTLKKDLKAAFTEWGEDARAILRIKWKNGGGHFVTIRKDDGNIIIEDPQNGKKYDIDWLKTNLTSTRFTNWLMRVDNRPLTENVDYAVKNREK